MATFSDHSTLGRDEVRTTSKQTQPNWTVSWLLAAGSFIATLASTAKGPGLSPDSISYISAGIGLAEGEGLVGYTGETLTIFPPGLPLIIAAGELLGVGSSWTMRLINAAAFATIVVLSTVLLHRHVASRWLAQGATILVAVGVALLDIASMAWTEQSFIVAMLVFLLGMERALAEPWRWRWVIACALLVWPSFLLRYAGVALIAVGGATLLVGLWKTSPLVATRNAAAFGMLACVGPIVWMLRNRSIDGTLMGPRYPSTDTPIHVAYRIVLTVGRWVVPLPLPGPLLGIVGIALLAGLVAGTVFVLRSPSNSPAARLDLSLLPLAVFGLGYTAYLILAQLTTAFDGISTRLLSPVFVPLVVLVTVALDRLAPLLSAKGRRVAAAALVAVVALQGSVFILDTVRSMQNGGGYASDDWQQSELAGATRDLPNGAVLYASQPDGIWAATRRDEPVLLSPRLRALGSSDVLVEISSDFLRDAACNETYLAWFDGNGRDYLRTPDQLAGVVSLEPVAQLSDGTLYRLGPIGVPECSETAND